jgi:hypothetical protein
MQPVSFGSIRSCVRPSQETTSRRCYGICITTHARGSRPQNGLTADLLLLGASLTVVLNQDGTTSGRLVAPGMGENGADVDEDLAGTWTLQGSTVRFDQPGDTFVRDVPFTAEPNRLRAEGTFDGVIVRAVLTK